jgi:tetratricopeptide (TPR) repeat protein
MDVDAASPPNGPPVPPGPFAIRPVPFPAVVGEAMSALEARLERFPSYPDLWNRLGLYQAASGRLNDAGSSFERALAINPRFLGAIENRGWIAVAAADHDAWHRFLEGPEFLRLHPGVRHHLLLFATARFESPSRALVMSSMPPQGRYEAAHLLDRLWILLSVVRTGEAQHLVEDITCSDPALRGAFGTCGMLGTQVAAEAWVAWQSAYAFNPQLSEVAAHSAQWCQREGQMRESRALVDWALAGSLDLPSFWVNLALHHDAAGEDARTLPCLERAVAANPQNRRARKELALVLVKRNRPREAITQFEILREVAPNYADVRFHLGILYRDRGDLDPAADELTAALAGNPRFTRAALLLAEVRLDQERWVEARAAYERVLADGLDGPTIRTRLATVYDRLGEIESAEASLARAIELGPDVVDALRARAEWFERHGRTKEAKADRTRLDALLHREGAGPGSDAGSLPAAA